MLKISSLFPKLSYLIGLVFYAFDSVVCILFLLTRSVHVPTFGGVCAAEF